MLELWLKVACAGTIWSAVVFVEEGRFSFVIDPDAPGTRRMHFSTEIGICICFSPVALVFLQILEADVHIRIHFS